MDRLDDGVEARRCGNHEPGMRLLQNQIRARDQHLARRRHHSAANARMVPANRAIQHKDAKGKGKGKGTKSSKTTTTTNTYKKEKEGSSGEEHSHGRRHGHEGAVAVAVAAAAEFVRLGPAALASSSQPPWRARSQGGWLARRGPCKGERLAGDGGSNGRIGAVDRCVT